MAELILTWMHLPPEPAVQLYECSTDAMVLKIVRDNLAGKCEVSGERRTAAFEDVLYYAMLFGRKTHLDPEQLSALFGIFVELHLYTMKTAELELNATFAYFKNLLIRHGVQRPPFSAGIFSFHQCNLILEYALNTYFRHFKLYKLAYAVHRRAKVVLEPTQLVPNVAKDDTETTDAPSIAVQDEPDE